MNRVFLGVLAISLTASAYILPGNSLLRRMAKARGQLELTRFQVDGSFVFRGLAAQEITTGLNLGEPKQELQGDGRFSFKGTGACSLELGSVDGRQKLKMRIDGGSNSSANAAFPLLRGMLNQLCPVFSHANEGAIRSAVDKNLRRLTIDPSQVLLDRLEGQITYVLGEAGLNKPQFWLYKESFNPARVRFASSLPSSPMLDLKLLDYASPVTGEQFPGKLELSSGEDWMIRFNALKAGNALPE